MISFVILEIYFFITLIAYVLFIYLMCIREPENKGFLIGFIVPWLVWGLLCVTYNLSVFCISGLITWDEAVPAFKQGLSFRNLYILQLPEQ